MSVLNFLSDFFCSQLQSKQAKQQAYVCGRILFHPAHLFREKKVMSIYLKSFFHILLIHFFQLLYCTVCINVNPEMAGLSKLLFSHTGTHCQIFHLKRSWSHCGNTFFLWEGIQTQLGMYLFPHLSRSYQPE